MMGIKIKEDSTGFTLVETLLVMVVISMMIVMGIGYLQQKTLALRVDRTSLQMQQILNAGLTYYVVNNYWPASLSCLQGSTSSPCSSNSQNYLPASIVNPWAQNYVVLSSTSTPAPSPPLSPGLLYVYTKIIAASGSGSAVGTAAMIAGKLPLSYTTSAAPVGGKPPKNDGSCALGSGGSVPTTCYVVATVNIPGQNLNNATAVNYAGLFHNGACVLAPQCPVDAKGNTMVPQVLVVPVSVSGVNDAPTGSGPCTPTDLSGCVINVYPVSSFTAYATPASTSPTGNLPGNKPYACGTTNPAPCYTDYTNKTQLNSGNYWRACLSATTQRGLVAPTANPWGQLEGTVLAITRCASPSESTTSSGFTVWEQ